MSAQVLNELASVLLRNVRSSRLAPAEVFAIVSEIPSLAEVVPISGSMTLEALKGMERFGISFWDALIWVAARDVGARVLYSEDFQSGRSLDGVLFVNPFA